MKILLINSDLASNRGDRAIAEGNILLIRKHFPEAEITGLSENPERDSEWYGIDFLDMNFQSLNPIDFIRLAKVAKSSDIVLWGGGEILKDYTNKAALWYWVAKISLLSRVNSNIYGAYQGIGPTKSSISKRLIVHVVGRTRKFIVRDDESHDKLISWGVSRDKVVAASDPAVIVRPEPLSDELIGKICASHGVEKSFFDNFICIGPRDWFHYKQSGILPYKYKKKLLNILRVNTVNETIEHKAYIKNLHTLVATLAKEHNVNILLMPMHMEESDKKLCQLLAKSNTSTQTYVADKDDLSPSELRSLISGAKAMVGFRLHSNIIGISSGVPSINVYYVDKGRVFFDQVRQSKFCLPIENSLEDTFSKDITLLLRKLLQNRDRIKSSITIETDRLRSKTINAFSDNVTRQ